MVRVRFSRTALDGATRTKATSGALTVGAIGVVFGDIGTSPLYAMRQAFTSTRAPKVDESSILGICSLILWALLIVVTVKYVQLVLRADSDGEGGILSLFSLIDRSRLAPRTGSVVAALGIFGTALLYGDGVITPAISVLSAVEGFEVAAPGISRFVDYAAIAILVGLFAVQRRGTARIARVFGPIMIVWFVTIAALGLRWILTTPTILRAASPSYAIGFLVTHGTTGFLALGAVFLAVTGAEALYADLGHFGRTPITRGWYWIVLPALVLGYLGQGAALLDDPARVSNPFFEMAPSAVIWPLAALSTMATIIASQALITGVFSLSTQAIHLGYLPRLRVEHTSSDEAGQIYVPAVNWALLAMCVGLIVGFRSSARLADAYGIAVVSTMAITTVLLYLVMRQRWQWSKAKAVLVCAPLLAVDLLFLGANAPKIPTGGWLPLLIAAILFTVLTTWNRGRAFALANQSSCPITQLSALLIDHPPERVPGAAVYLHRDPIAIPPALTKALAAKEPLHELVVFVDVASASTATVPLSEAVEVQHLVPGIWTVSLHFGFVDHPDIPAGLHAAAEQISGFDPATATYYVTDDQIISTNRPGMTRWRKRMFASLNRRSIDMADYFRLPSAQVIEIARRVEI